MVLQFQKKVALPKAFLIFSGRLLCFLQHSFLDITLHLARQAGRKCDNALMKFPQHFHIHTGPVIITLRMAAADDFRQVFITDIIFCQKNEVIISVLSADQFLIETGIRCNIDLTA